MRERRGCTPGTEEWALEHTSRGGRGQEMEGRTLCEPEALGRIHVWRLND